MQRLILFLQMPTGLLLGVLALWADFRPALADTSSWLNATPEARAKALDEALNNVSPEVRVLDLEQVLFERNEARVRELLKQQPSLAKVVFENGETPLHRLTRVQILEPGTAVRDGDGAIAVRLVQYFLEAGADPNIVNAWGETPLLIASSQWVANKSSGFDLARTLIEAGAQVNQPDDQGQTPLFKAAEIGRTSLVVLLLNHGADKTIRDHDNDTARDVAVRNNHSEVVKELSR